MLRPFRGPPPSPATRGPTPFAAAPHRRASRAPGHGPPHHAQPTQPPTRWPTQPVAWAIALRVESRGGGCYDEARHGSGARPVTACQASLRTMAGRWCGMASEPTPSFGDLLRRQRKAAGLTQAELGERTFAAAVQEGGALSLEEVVAEALEG